MLVSSPLNSIPDFVIPSHVVVPRCQGLCLGSLGALFPLFLSSVTTSSGSDCAPKRTKVEEHSIVVYVNATPYCTKIQLEHHRGPCRCQFDLCSLSANVSAVYIIEKIRWLKIYKPHSESSVNPGEGPFEEE